MHVGTVVILSCPHSWRTTKATVPKLWMTPCLEFLNRPAVKFEASETSASSRKRKQLTTLMAFALRPCSVWGEYFEQVLLVEGARERDMGDYRGAGVSNTDVTTESYLPESRGRNMLESGLNRCASPAPHTIVYGMMHSDLARGRITGS